MPFGPFRDWEDCIAKNADRRDPEAYCGVIKRAIEGGEFTVTEESHGKKLLLNVEIFQTGVHVPAEGEVKNWSTSELQDIVKAFGEGVNSPVYLKIGHTTPEFCEMVAKKLGVPVEVVKGEGPAGNGMISLGKAIDVRLREDGVMLADFEAPSQIADLIEKGYTDVSIELQADYPGHPWVLSAVALLGAERPAVKGLAGLEEVAVLAERKPSFIMRFSATPHGLVQFQNDPTRICGNIWFNGTEAQRGAFGGGTEGRGRDEKPPAAWWDDCIATIGGSKSQSSMETVSLEELEEINSQMEQFIKGKKAANLLRQAWGQIKQKWASLLGIGEQLNQEGDMDKKKIIAALKMQEGTSDEEVLGRLNQIMEAIAAIAQALGIGAAPVEGEIPPEALAAKVKELVVAKGKESFSTGQFAEKLQAAENKVASLERDKRVAQFKERVGGLTVIEGTPDKLAEELVIIQEKMGSEAADRTLSQWKQTQKFAEQAGIMARIGTARGGEGKSAIEVEMEQWLKDKPNKTMADAYAWAKETKPNEFQGFRISQKNNGS